MTLSELPEYELLPVSIINASVVDQYSPTVKRMLCSFLAQPLHNVLLTSLSRILYIRLFMAGRDTTYFRASGCRRSTCLPMTKKFSLKLAGPFSIHVGAYPRAHSTHTLSDTYEVYDRRSQPPRNAFHPIPFYLSVLSPFNERPRTFPSVGSSRVSSSVRGTANGLTSGPNSCLATDWPQRPTIRNPILSLSPAIRRPLY